jgi:hypothetical protein
MGLAIWIFASWASAQATPGPSRIQERKEKPANPVVVAPAQQAPHPVVPIYGAAAPEQTLPQPPEIAWDGKQLTIDAENSRLSDILLAIRAKTGASVEFPGGATSERVAEAGAALAAKKEAEADSAVTAESAAATGSDVPTRGEGAAASSSESAAAGPSPTNTDPKSVPAATSSADGSTVAVGDIPQPSTAAASSSGDSSGEQSEASRKVQNRLNMFEQRRQIQAQQNQRAAPTTTN